MIEIKDIAQAVLLICSATGVWFMAGKRYKTSFAISLIGQPAWFYTSYITGQWGVFILSLWFTYNNIRGLRNHWRD